MKRLMIVAMVVGCLGAFAFGQTANAVLTGTTVDSSGALIPGVEVRATNVETGVTTTGVSNETGAYRIGSLLPGVYTVRAELPGFRVQTFTDVRLGSDIIVGVISVCRRRAAAKSNSEHTCHQRRWRRSTRSDANVARRSDSGGSD